MAPEEVRAHAAMVQAQAAQTQAFAAAAALEHKTGSVTDAKHAKDPSASHPTYVLRRCVLFLGGSQISTIAPEESLSASYQETLQAQFRSPFRTQTTFGLEHDVSVNMVVSAARGDFTRFYPDEFVKRSVDQLHAAVPVMEATPLKFEPPPKPVMDTDAFYGCVERAALFLSLVYYEKAGRSLRAFNDATYAIINDDPALGVGDYRAIITDALRRLSLATRVELERVSAKAQELGKAPVGAGAQGLQTLRDVGLVLHKVTKQTFMKNPFDVLDPTAEDGPLRQYLDEKRCKLARALQALAAEQVANGSAGKGGTPAQYAKGLNNGTLLVHGCCL